MDLTDDMEERIGLIKKEITNLITTANPDKKPRAGESVFVFLDRLGVAHRYLPFLEPVWGKAQIISPADLPS